MIAYLESLRRLMELGRPITTIAPDTVKRWTTPSASCGDTSTTGSPGSAS